MCAGKGSRIRPYSKARYDAGYENIDWRKKDDILKNIISSFNADMEKRLKTKSIGRKFSSMVG